MTSAHIGPNVVIPLRYANRHGLITGPTGTGKTVSIIRLVESFASQSVSVIAPDAKGDLSALARSCRAASDLQELMAAGYVTRNAAGWYVPTNLFPVKP